MAEAKFVQSDFKKDLYVRYIDDEVNLQLSEWKWNDMKYFKHEFEPVLLANEKDMVNIKCLDNNKYWEAKLKDKTQWIVVAEAEDGADKNTWFKLEKVGDAPPDDVPTKFRLHHILRDQYAFVKPDLDRYLLLAEQPPSDGRDIFNIKNLDLK